MIGIVGIMLIIFGVCVLAILAMGTYIFQQDKFFERAGYVQFPLEYASRLYRVVSGKNLLPGDLENVSIEEAEKYIVTESFETFLVVNKIKIL